MFLIDNILLSPARGLLAVFREVHKAAEQEIANRAETIRTKLSELYLLLESGHVTEEEFDTKEKELLDILDAIEQPDEADETEAVNTEAVETEEEE